MKRLSLSSVYLKELKTPVKQIPKVIYGERFISKICEIFLKI